MPKYDNETIPVCVNCDRNSQVKTCNKCHIEYCKHYSSKTDIQFCANCVSDIHLEEKIMFKEIEHIRTDGTVSFSRKSQARLIRLMNVDWLFHNKAIEDSTDAEIDASIEYHAAIKDLMLQERASRQLERSRKLASIKILHVDRKSQHELERDASKGSKTRTKTKEKAIDSSEDLLKALALLMSKGMTLEQIGALTGGKK